MIIIASQNKNKVAEITLLESAKGLEIKSIGEFPGCPEVEEDGTTFEENAAIKAVKYSLWLKREHRVWPMVVAEDSGLEVEALMGWPGVMSARIAKTDEQKLALVLAKLKGNLNRAARFVACTSLAVNGHFVRSWQGIAQGQIIEAPVGEGGFGYDPIFLDPKLCMTFAEASSEEKAKRSHRSKAWDKALSYINKYKQMLQ